MQLRKIVSADVVAAMLGMTATQLWDFICHPAEGSPKDRIVPAQAWLVAKLPKPIEAEGDGRMWFEDELIQWQQHLAIERRV